ncbi:hypothetical protein KL908_002904 [Ogataea polymorpha]|nr:hypothetical protein KL908_002904 [Ogataea polymorpha]
MTDVTKPLEIAIVGGGIVGAFAAATLSRLPNSRVTLYEKSEGPREAGAWIALTEAALLTLSRIANIEKVQEFVYRGKPEPLARRHWKTGEVLKYDTSSFPRPDNFVQARTHRVPLHNFVLKHVPEGVIKYNHAAVKVDVDSSGAILHFENQDPVRADLVVAADGIYSRIRRQFRVNEKLEYKGIVAYRYVFDEKLLKDVHGVLDDTSAWMGRDGTWVFLGKVGLGKYGFVALIPEPPNVASDLTWNRSAGQWGISHLLEFFQEWDPLITKIIKVLPEILAFPLERAPWLQDLIIGDRIAFAGDAAHPTSGVYAVGSSMGFDDIWALYRALSETSTKFTNGDPDQQTKYNLPLSLFLFNETRKHFLQRVERQTFIDSEVKKKYLNLAKDDADWQRRLLNSLGGLDWVKEHNVELEYQKVRDEHFLKIYT